MEASALQAPAGLARTRLSIGASLLRLRSDEQLVALFREGHEEAFRVIHDRYRTRLFAYTRQMLPGSRQDAEDALQDIFVRAYSGLRANGRALSLRAWLYRVAHNRCVDELRKPPPPAPEVLGILRPPSHDPTAQAEQRESLRRLIADVRRLPDQQRSALLMRELGGIAYCDVAAALGVSVPAVKSLLVRARVGLAQALEARDTACAEIREDLIVAHDRGVRPSGLARRHMHDCAGCREFRGQIRGVSKQFAALVPTIGPLGVVANILGIGGGGGAAAAGTGAAAAGGAAGTGGAVASVGALAGVGHVATLLAAAVVTAGGAVELQHTISSAHHARHHVSAVAARNGDGVPAATAAAATSSGLSLAPAATPARQAAGPPAHRAAGSGSSTATPVKPPDPATTVPPSGMGTPGPGAYPVTAGTTTGTPVGTPTATGSDPTTASGTGTTDPTATGSDQTSSSPTTDPSSPTAPSTVTATGDSTTLGSSATVLPASTSSSATSGATRPAPSHPSGGVSISGAHRHHW
jgi:RNA polymerase sigma factor (sigma-70 family)